MLLLCSGLFGKPVLFIQKDLENWMVLRSGISLSLSLSLQLLGVF